MRKGERIGWPTSHFCCPPTAFFLPKQFYLHYIHQEIESSFSRTCRMLPNKSKAPIMTMGSSGRRGSACARCRRFRVVGVNVSTFEVPSVTIQLAGILSNNGSSLMILLSCFCANPGGITLPLVLRAQYDRNLFSVDGPCPVTQLTRRCWICEKENDAQIHFLQFVAVLPCSLIERDLRRTEEDSMGCREPSHRSSCLD